MRITIATGPSFPVPALQGGAIARLWQGLAEEFARHGHDVCIFARAFPGQPATEEMHGVRYQRWGGFAQSLSIKKDLAKDFVYGARAISRLPQADILVTNTFWLPVWAGLLRAQAGKIVVNANRFPKGQYRLYTKAARIAAASNAIREAIIAQTPSIAPRIKVFPNPIDTTLLAPSWREEAPTKTLLYTGRLHPEKGVHLLVQAFAQVSAQHPGWQLRLVGPTLEKQGGGGASYEQQLQHLAQNKPIEFAGPIFDAARLAEVYRSADLFCYPSLAEKGESFGVAPLEAMATGLVPVVSSLACFNDFIRDNETGFFFNHRASDPVQELAQRLAQAMGDWQRTKAIGASAAQVAQQFSFAQVAQAYLADFEELLKASAA